MIKKIADEIEFKKIKLDSWSFKCDKCGVLIGTCFDFKYNDDWAIESKSVKNTAITCGKCRLMWVGYD